MPNVPSDGPFCVGSPIWTSTSVLVWTIPLVTYMSLGVWGPFWLWKGIKCPACYIQLMYRKSHIFLRIHSNIKYFKNDGHITLLMFVCEPQDICLWYTLFNIGINVAFDVKWTIEWIVSHNICSMLYQQLQLFRFLVHHGYEPERNCMLKLQRECIRPRKMHVAIHIGQCNICRVHPLWIFGWADAHEGSQNTPAGLTNAGLDG